jgi:CHAD domain-containing protein
VRELRRPAFTDMLEEWDRALVQLALAPTRPSRVRSSSSLGHESVGAKWRQVAKLGRAISDSSPPARLHELRKRLKELRYALEVFDPVLPQPDTRAAVSEVKRLQDVLGRYQDADVQRIRLRAFADEMLAEGVPAATMLAMGELVAHLDADQQRARAGFRSAFTRFDRRASRERFRSLGGSG